tara:strand:- start:167 stop:490 length:324 start_codon:yes stop_codon:yes gene_type:complete
MKDYATRKKNKKWSVAKTKVVTTPAVSEVKDDKGVVVRHASAEVSHDEIKLTKKRFDPETGSALADVVQSVSVQNCDDEIARFDKQIAEATAQKEGWEALKKDIQAL